MCKKQEAQAALARRTRQRTSARPQGQGGIDSYLVLSESAYPFSQLSQIVATRDAGQKFD
jgi:hypothetical protein